MARATQKSISDALNVSVMTVSKALRGAPDISEEMRKRVLAEARRHKYVPNLLARDLLNQRTKAIGFIFPDITYGYAQNIVDGAKSVLREKEYRTLIGLTSWSPKEEQQEVDLMLGRQVEGMICQPIPGSKETFQRIVDYGIPLVFVGDCLDIPQASWVGLDGKDACQKVMAHLYSLGHRRIGFIAPYSVEQSASLRPRLSAYKSFLCLHGIDVDPELICLSKLGSGKDIAPLTDKLMSVKNPPTAIVGISDAIAYLIMDRLMKKGYRIPEDVAVVGMGGISVSAYEMIALTTVEENTYQIGRCAAEILLQQLANKSVTPVRKLLRGSLIIRRSTERGFETTGHKGKII